MPILKVVTYPDRILIEKTSEIRIVRKQVKSLIANMIETMYAQEGVGIAANQVGVSKRIFIASPSGKRGDAMVFINPVILKHAGVQVGPEGCLSVPSVALEIRRAKYIAYEALNEAGELISGQASDFLARIIQHEIDHLNGKLIIDCVDFDQRQTALSVYNRL